MDPYGQGGQHTEAREAHVPSRWDPTTDQLPTSLCDLAGPTHGTADLPLHLAWSGLRSFDLDDDKLLLGMYRIVLTTGLRDDYVQFLDGSLLAARWPQLRKMVGRGVRTTWEDAFPELRPDAGKADARTPGGYRISPSTTAISATTRSIWVAVKGSLPVS